MQPRKKVIIDVDTGVDDAHALLLALRSPALDVIGITTVAGNTNVEQVTLNTLKVLDIAAASLNIPVAKGFSSPLLEGTHYCPMIHGLDGLGNLNNSPSTRPISSMHAVNFLITTLLAAVEPVTLIMLAPHTNVAVALRMEPKIKEKIAEVIVMSGSAKIGGNSTQWAEANVYCDPEAAQIVFSSGLNIVMYSWDVYVQVEFSRSETEVFAKSPNPWAQFSAKLFEFDMKNCNLESCTIGDAGAVAAAILPEGLVTEILHVVVELQGTHTRGMTVVDLRKEVYTDDKQKQTANVRVAVGVNVDLYKNLYRNTLLG